MTLRVGVNRGYAYETLPRLHCSPLRSSGPIAQSRVLEACGRIAESCKIHKLIPAYSTISANVVGQGGLFGLARLLSRHPATVWLTTSYVKIKSPIIPSLTLKSLAGKEVTTVYGDMGVVSRAPARGGEQEKVASRLLWRRPEPQCFE